MDEIGDKSLETITEKEEDVLCEDWVKAQMDEETWRKMSEKERQAYLAKMKLLQRQLRKDMYGDRDITGYHKLFWMADVLFYF